MRYVKQKNSAVLFRPVFWPIIYINYDRIGGYVFASNKKFRILFTCVNYYSSSHTFQSQNSKDFLFSA